MRPTREGRTGANRPGLVFKGIGVDPDTETEDPEPPPDQAAAMNGAQAYIAYLPPPDPSVTDLNLSFGTDYDGGGDRPVTDPTFANDGNMSTIAGRASYFNTGTKTWYLEADLGAAYDVDEIVVRGGWGNSGENDPAWIIQHSPDSSTWTTAVGTYVWTPTGSPRTATLTLTSTQTKRYWRIGQSLSFSGLAYPLKVHTWQVNGDPGAVDPTNIIFIDGPLTIDDDDTTYEMVFTDAIADKVWRVTLADSYLISSINLRIAFENAGAVTLLLQAGNEADYSDAATIATLTATGTGSFTAQDITASFSPTSVYQYWQLLLTSTAQDIHIHTVNLFGPVDPTGVHGDLTGLEDADQHPASSITFTPYSTIAATNVQDAIEEVLDEAGAGSLTDHTHAVTGSGATGGGGVLNTSAIDATGFFRMSGFITSTINADQNDYNPTNLHTSGYIRFTSFSANRTITGLNAGTTGDLLIMVNNTSFSLLLPNESASSSAANRFRSPAAATHTVRQSGSVLLFYAGGRWCIIAA